MGEYKWLFWALQMWYIIILIFNIIIILNIIIDCDISTPGHVKEGMGGLNATDIRFIFHLMSTFQLLGSKWFDTQTEVHTESQNTHVSLAMEFQNHLSNESCKHGILD